MVSKVDFDTLANEIVTILHDYGLRPNSFGLSFTLSSEDFDKIAADYPGHHPEMILISKGDDIQWYVQITRGRAFEEFPPGAILSPPPDENT
jgi:hypothetical protein